jgi:hypothetical protein
MKLNGLDKFLWLQSDLALLYNRTFPCVWDLWVQICCSRDPQNWPSYVTVAFLLLTFPFLSQVGEDDVFGLADSFPSQLTNLNLNQIARLALFVYERCPLGHRQEEAAALPADSEFFVPSSNST